MVSTALTAADFPTTSRRRFRVKSAATARAPTEATAVSAILFSSTVAANALKAAPLPFFALSILAVLAAWSALATLDFLALATLASLAA